MEPITKLKPDIIKTFNDPLTGLHAFLVIDRSIYGAATGGIRMTEDVTLEEVANLAHEMRLKFAFLSIKKDGAKAGIVAPPNLTAHDKYSLCRAFGAAIKDLVRKGAYCPGQDIGIHTEEFSAITGSPPASFPSHYFTALTVFLSIKTLLETHDLHLKNITALLEGFGNVGEELALMLNRAGVVIRGISTQYGGIYRKEGLPIDQLLQLKRELGDEWVKSTDAGKHIDSKKLFEQESDLLIPGARPDSISTHNIDSIRTKFIVPIANIPATEEIEEMLYKKGAVYIPGFVANCGGVLSYFLQEQSFDAISIEHIIRIGIPMRLQALINKASVEKKSIARAAREIAERQQIHARTISWSTLCWLLYKQLSRIGMGFVLQGFAKRYIISKHFKML